MTVRSTVALAYVFAAALAALVSGPGPHALAGEIAVFSVFEPPREVLTLSDAMDLHWEIEDLPAYLTRDPADLTRADLVLPVSVY